MLNPMLTYLRLDYCGLINDTVITSWCNALPTLVHLELLGPFLVHSAAWISFFEAHPKLEAFLITQSPRFDLECMRSLVQSCTGLRNLRLKEVGKLDDDFLLEIATLGDQLHSLDLSDPATPCSEKAFITLLSAVGKNLRLLNLSGHTDLTDALCIDGLVENVHRLTSLSLSNIPELTDDGLASFFAQWQNMALTSIDLSRNPALGSATLQALLTHSGELLSSLNINGWRFVSPEALDEIPKRAKELKQLDVSWCRAADDFWMKEMLAECKSLQEVRCYGCNQLSVNCPRKVRFLHTNGECVGFIADVLSQRGILIRGVEKHSVL
jgi:DNA repair protein RAD7